MARVKAPTSALELLDEASVLLRRAGAATWAAYLAGAVPFLIACLWLTAAGLDRAIFPSETLGLAVLFAWLNLCRAVFSRRLLASLKNEAENWPGPGRCFEIAAMQSLFQGLKLVLLPLATLAMAPAAYAVAFFRNVAALAGETDAGLTVLAARAHRQAGMWQRQNWAALGIVSLFALPVFTGVGFTQLAAPQLARILTGQETELSRSGFGLLASPLFWAGAIGFTWLVLDPMLQAVYVLRCFQGEAVQTGVDLRSALKRLAVFAALACLCGSGPARADTRPTARIESLDRAIDQVLEKPEYAWRKQAKETPPDPVPEWLRKSGSTVKEWVDRAMRTVVAWFRPDKAVARPAWSRISPSAAIGLCLLLLAGGAWLLLRALRSRPRPGAPETSAAAPPDVLDPAVLATSLPEESWLQLAQECGARGELRPALRALFLGTLAHLAGRELLAIRASKTNRDYCAELRRRAAPALPIFGDTVARFERVWYSAHPASEEELAACRSNLEQLRGTA